jgi:hypothetical protein
MVQQGPSPESEFRQIREALARHRPVAQSKGEVTRFCAYNETRERFLSADVEVADFSAATLDARLPALTPASGVALWILPFRGIHPASVRIPLDLLYLDRNCVVLDAVESFPISPESPSSSLAASLVVLPAETIASSRIRFGDRLLLCSPDEMRRRLQLLVSARRDNQVNQDFARGLIGLPADQPGAGANVNVPKWEVHSGGKATPENAPVDTSADATSQPPTAPAASPSPETAEPARKTTKASKNWWRGLWNRDPPEPRTASRESPPWLIAYFFTGGVPVAHPVRDVSLSGLYVVTDEQWYLGTIVRITLTDQREQTVDRSFTLNAKVVRRGNDGAGLQFLLDDEKAVRSMQTHSLEDEVERASKQRLKQFLRRLNKFEA